MNENEIRMPVTWGDCDPANIVFYPNYFRWFDHATAELFAASGLDMATLYREHGVIGMPILEAKATFSAPGHFRDTMVVRSRVAEWRRTSFRVEHTVFNGGQQSAVGHEIRAWVTRLDGEGGRLKAIPIPDSVKACFPGAEQK